MLGYCARGLVQNDYYQPWNNGVTIKVYKETWPYITIPPELFKPSEGYCGGTYTQTIEFVEGADIAEVGTIDAATGS